MTLEDIKTIGIVGAGQMGRGIAQVCATAGYRVLLVDVTEASLTEALAKIRAGLERASERGSLTSYRAGEALALIRPTVELDRLHAVQLVIEAIPEDLALKERLFAELNRICRPRAILASNTSSISITKLGTAAGRPADVVGLHFMNPAPVMHLLEVVRGLETSETTLNLALGLAKRLGKTPVLAKDVPGFIVNRILIPMINEAIFALENGVASAEDIDLAMVTGANHPVGPLALADRIGLDTVLSICDVLHRGLGDAKFRPCPLLRRYVEAGWLGRKTGRGFFLYEASGERREALSGRT
ncbi:putative 3-hydroxybutyryl-CoA dehydrogenase [Nitrospira japonica]|uniref:Putative 3-hydroxybutyryl-CoA dehydrogenase n=1 Tax=Nitrospira japonica TaxID=1325564 RepID=A0A1W1I1H4_9BACT|nr:3-hydroxyacyl-CoA dehydrogenase NAD-binding domain-containing protein [Nitrospira japonica]SLM46719.1 putative 3-hydroxybutyryl-CoA dehydrogenase [Nitrospira japonica]